eukprot:m51a1_g13920 hypothetical protein (428) ;mRNA; r:813673-815143
MPLTLAACDADADFNKRMSLIEFVMYRFRLQIVDVINAPQGENKEEVAKAQAVVAAAQRAVDDMTAKLETSRAAEAASKKAAEAAWYAEQENKKALEELHAQERAFEARKSELEGAKNDASVGVVKRNKAANELEQLLAEDPLPLRKAKINQAAAVKKAEKASAAASEAKAKAEADARAVEAATREAEARLQEAVDYLEKVKKMGGTAQGDIWYARLAFVMYRFRLQIVDVINAPQGENKEEVAKAQAVVAAAQRAVDDMTAKLETSRAAEAASKKAAEAAWYAEQENKKALEELHAQERAFEARKSELEGAKNDASVGVVKRNKAANELEQLLAEDPLPLRKAKINQAAAVKKAEKASAAASEAKAKAEADARAVEAATREAEARLQEAVDYLEKVKKMGGTAQGDIWWMQREITEKRKYMPSSKK